MRILCLTSAEAIAIATYLASEDQDACWLATDDGPVVITTADHDTARAAIAFVGGR